MKTVNTNHGQRIGKLVRTTLLTLSILVSTVSSVSWAGVVCANGNVGAALDVGFFPSAAITPLPAPAGYSVFTPLPPGCNPATFVKGKSSVTWQIQNSGVGAGGDTIDWSKSWVNGYGYGRKELDPDDGLMELATPTSYEASTTLSVSAKILSPTQALFTVTWMGSDQGVAQRLRWYDYNGPVPAITTGDNTEIPGWTQFSTLLDEKLRVGPWSESIQVPITASNVHNIILVENGVVKSLPGSK